MKKSSPENRSKSARRRSFYRNPVGKSIGHKDHIQNQLVVGHHPQAHANGKQLKSGYKSIASQAAGYKSAIGYKSLMIKSKRHPNVESHKTLATLTGKQSSSIYKDLTILVIHFICLYLFYASFWFILWSIYKITLPDGGKPRFSRPLHGNYTISFSSYELIPDSLDHHLKHHHGESNMTEIFNKYGVQILDKFGDDIVDKYGSVIADKYAPAIVSKLSQVSIRKLSQTGKAVSRVAFAPIQNQNEVLGPNDGRPFIIYSCNNST